MQLPASFVNNDALRSNEFATFDELKFVLVVEKETLFQQLLQMEWYTYLELTG